MATIKSVKPGDWHSADTWGGSIPGEMDDIIVAHKLTSNNKNIVIGGSLSTELGAKAGIQFLNVNEDNYIGGGHHVLPSDTGLWVTGKGQLKLEGRYKKPYAWSAGPVKKGDAKIVVDDPNGWAIGDEVVVLQLRKPPAESRNWDDRTMTPTDAHHKEFERRKITAIAGKEITISSALTYDHNSVSLDDGRIITTPVMNLTRDFVIEGQPGKRAHVLITAQAKQLVKNIEFTNLGPRKSGQKKIDDTGKELNELVTPKGGRTTKILGRYMLHLHHTEEGSRGSEIDSNSFHDGGNEAIVTHGSHGVAAKNNVIAFCLESGLWYDEGHHAHDLLWERNMITCVGWNGVDQKSTAISLAVGDQNVCFENICIYANGDEKDMGGAYAWDMGRNEGVWHFEGNIGIANRQDIWSWQNSSRNHTLSKHLSVNNLIGAFIGAYGNAYNIMDCYFHDSRVQIKASSQGGWSMQRCTFDGANQIDHAIEIQSSPIASTPLTPDFFINNIYKRTRKKPILMDTDPRTGDGRTKIAAIIGAGVSPALVDFRPDAAFDSYFNIISSEGQMVKVTKGGASALKALYPFYWGTGTGLMAQYYTGKNFDSLKASMLEGYLRFDHWREWGSLSGNAIYKTPYAVHHLVDTVAFSARFTGFIEPQSTEAHTFVISGSGGNRMWIEDKLIMDSWFDKPDSKDQSTSQAINLEKGKKYKIRIDHFNEGGQSGMIFMWQTPTYALQVVPQTQLYPSAVVEPVVYKNSVQSKPFTRNNCATGAVPGSVVYSVPAGAYSSLISQADADSKALADIAANGQNYANINATCTLPNVYWSAAKSQAFTRNNCGAGSLGSTVTYTVPAGKYSSIISQADADAKALADIVTNGQNYANLSGTCTVIPPVRTVIIEFIIGGRKYVVYSDHPSTPVQ